MDKKFLDRTTINIVSFSFLSFVEALQILIIVALIFSFIPIPVPAFVQKLFPLSLYDVRLERESFFYHAWIAAGLGIQAILIYLNRRRINDQNLWRGAASYTVVMAGIILIQIFAIFKIFLWNNPWWARDLLYFSIGLAALVRIFWPEFKRISLGFWKHWAVLSIPRWGAYLMDGGVLLLLFVLIFSPDLNKVLARMFTYDKFYHFDSFIMSPAWAHHQGLVLNKDVTSEYSLIIPLVFEKLMKVMGGISYAHGVGLMIALCMVYYFLLYGLLRFWVGSIVLAFFAVILCVKLQFFHWGIIPLIWIYPSATPLRSLFDLFFLFFILRFTHHLKISWLYAASVVSGLSVIWTLDVGGYLYLTLVTAALGQLFLNKGKGMIKTLTVLAIPWVIVMGVLGLCYGTLIWQNYFWHQTFELASLFLQGWGALPITEGLKDKQFFAFCMGFLIPLIYLGTLLYSLGMFIFRQSRPHFFMVLVTVYGLGLYHYFIHRSGVTSYYAVIVPFIFTLLFWLQTTLRQCSVAWQKGIKAFLCAWALLALLTGYLFTYYPNFLNLSGYDWSNEIKFYVENFDFSQDAQLIDSWTSPEESVVLISSFETKILMQANRKPFFYYFPFVESEHMQGDKLRGIYLHTWARLGRTLDQLKSEKPACVFIQTRLYEGKEAEVYQDTHEGFNLLMAYIRQNYEYQAQGQYLTVLKLK